MLIFCACLQILIIPNKYILKYNLTIILGNNTILQYVASVGSGYQHQKGAKVLLTT